MENKLVSIIMPSYNTGNYIGESIAAVLEQSYTDWELIIVDDCSTDNTEQIVESFRDERIRYLKNEKNSGAAVSRNKALLEAKGKWIAFLDSDDLWSEDKLEKQIRFMQENEYYFSYTKYSEIDEESKSLNVMVSGPKVITKRGMFRYCWPGCLTVMYDREKIGLIQIEDIKKNNDYAMWLKVIKKAKCYLLDENLAKYRKRRGSISNYSYKKLIKWHYRLFREVEKMGVIRSVYHTVGNLIFGVIKKLKYVKS